MRIDFNQRGSWRKGPEFDARDIDQVKPAAAALADLTGAKLRIVGSIVGVADQVLLSYRDAGFAWRDQQSLGDAQK